MSALALDIPRKGNRMAAAVDEKAEAPEFEDGPVGRLERQAYEKDLQVEELEEAGDEEGAHIGRIEADEFRSKAAKLKRALAANNEAADETKAEELKGEAGEPVGEMPPADPPETPELLPEDIVVAGLKIEPADLGGKAPTSGTLKLTGGKVKLMHGTFLKKGTLVHFSGTAVVNDLGQKDVTDTATQQVVDAVQSHSAAIRSLDVTIPDAE